MCIQAGVGKYTVDFFRFGEFAGLAPHGVVEGGDDSVLFRGADGGGDDAHGGDGVHREVRVHGERHLVARGVAGQVPHHVHALGGHGAGRVVAGGLEDAAEQDGDVDQLGAGALAQGGELAPGQVGSGAAHVKEEFDFLGHGLVLSDCHVGATLESRSQRWNSRLKRRSYGGFCFGVLRAALFKTSPSTGAGRFRGSRRRGVVGGASSRCRRCGPG